MDVLIKNKPAGYVPLPELQHFFSSDPSACQSGSAAAPRRKKKDTPGGSLPLSTEPSFPTLPIPTPSPPNQVSVSSPILETLRVQGTAREEKNNMIEYLTSLSISLDPLLKEVYQSPAYQGKEDPSLASAAPESLALPSLPLSLPLPPHTIPVPLHDLSFQNNLIPAGFAPYGYPPYGNFGGENFLLSNNIYPPQGMGQTMQYNEDDKEEDELN